jgi:hypothetical protein
VEEPKSPGVRVEELDDEDDAADASIEGAASCVII